MTLTGYATFSILIPAACVLFAAGIGFNRTVLKILAAKIAAFGLVIFMIIPFSMNVSAMIEKTYESTMEETVKEAQDITNEIEKNTDSEGNIIEKALSKIKDGISGLLEKGEELSEENLYGLTKDYLGKRLFYLPSEPVKSSDYLEYYLEREAVRTMECLERLSDMVMVDTSAAPLASSRKILQQADLVVVNLNQNLPLLSHFFRNYSSIQEKAFYLIGNYDGKSELTKSAIMKQFHIPGAKIGTIPHDTGFSDAMSRGQLIPFLLKNYMQENSLSHEMFMQAVKETVSLLQEQIRKHG